MRVITGTARGIRLTTPPGLDTRPTIDRVKEAVFSKIQFEIEGRDVLDLFAGSGQMGIEALSRGARHCDFCDLDQRACDCIRDNLRRTDLEQSGEIYAIDYLRMLSFAQRTRRYGLVFLDPPYQQDDLEQSLEHLANGDILTDDAVVVCECGLEKELPETAGCLVKGKSARYGKVRIEVYRRETR